MGVIVQKKIDNHSKKQYNIYMKYILYVEYKMYGIHIKIPRHASQANTRGLVTIAHTQRHRTLHSIIFSGARQEERMIA